MRAPRDTLPARFFANASRLGNRPAHYYLIAGEQYPVGWSTMARVVRDLAAGLIELGHEPGDKVALLSENRREWLYWDLACLSVGGISVGVHPGLSDEEVHAVLADSQARFCVVDESRRCAPLRREQLPSLERVIVVEPGGSSADGESVMSQAELRRRTQRSAHAVVSARLSELTAADAATFVYTETGVDSPHAAMFTHGAIVAAVDGLSAIQMHDGDKGYSYLPLACSTQRLLDYLCMCEARLWCYSAAGSLSDAPLFGPSVVVVDSIGLEDAVAAVYEYAARLPGSVDTVLRWVRAAGRAVTHHRGKGTPVPRHLARNLEAMREMVFEHVAGPWGKHVRLVLCHGDPPGQDILDFFAAAGVPLLEVWGPPECLGVATLNAPPTRVPGTVGRSALGMTILADVDAGLTMSGDQLFSGYYRRALDTGVAFDSSGGFRSDVLADVDAAGYVTLRGARQDVIVTTRGLTVSPEPIERMLTADPRIRQAVVVGDGRASLAVLVSVTAAFRAAVSEGDLLQLVETIVARRNVLLPRAEQLTGLRLLPYELTSESGELTASQKVRRRVVAERFSYLIDEMY